MLGKELGLISDPIFDSPTPYPFNISIFESTPLIHNFTHERVIYYLHLYQDWKHPLSGVWTLYQESTVRCKASSIKIQSRRHSLTHIPFQERPYSRRRRKKARRIIFTIIYKDLFWNLKKNTTYQAYTY